MSKLHSYYITNAGLELKYAFSKIPENQIHKQIEEIIRISQFGNEEDFNEFDDMEEIGIERLNDKDDENDEDDEDLNKDDSYNFENFYDFNDKDLKRALEMNVQVIIEPKEIDHGSVDFDSTELLDAFLK